MESFPKGITMILFFEGGGRKRGADNIAAGDAPSTKDTRTGCC